MVSVSGIAIIERITKLAPAHQQPSGVARCTIEIHFRRSHGNKHSRNAGRDDTTSSRHTKQYDAFDPTARHGTVIDIDTGITNDNDISNDIEHDGTRNDGPCQNG